MYVVHNIEGQRFGCLTAIRFDHGGSGPGKTRYKSYWLCHCDCGKDCFVERYNLISGKTRSCGHLRSNNIAMTRGQFRPVDIDDAGMQWIIPHYKHTKNDEIKARFGLTDGWLHRFARANGLKKSGQFITKCQRNAAARAHESHVANNTYPPKGYEIPGREKAGYKAGYLKHETKKQKELRISRSTATMREIRAAERTRIKYGYRQRTKLRLDGQTGRRYKQRYYLKRLGYILGAPDEWVAYYDENTRRSLTFENRPQDSRHYAYWKFLPISEKTNQ